jgi:hypothetical protein
VASGKQGFNPNTKIPTTVPSGSLYDRIKYLFDQAISGQTANSIADYLVSILAKTDVASSAGPNVPSADSTSNATTAQVVGNKTDTTVTTPSATTSLVAMVKGILNRLPTSGTVLSTANSPANFSIQSIDGSGRVDVGKVAGTAQTARDLGAQLDAAISSRAASATAVSNVDYTSGRAADLDKIASSTTHAADSSLGAGATLDLRPGAGLVRYVQCVMQGGTGGAKIEAWDGSQARTLVSIGAGTSAGWTGLCDSSVGIRLNASGSGASNYQYVAHDRTL